MEFLTIVEHVLVVVYLSVYCALGHDLGSGEGRATTTQGRYAAHTVFALALGEIVRPETGSASRSLMLDDSRR